MGVPIIMFDWEISRAISLTTLGVGPLRTIWTTFRIIICTIISGTSMDYCGPCLKQRGASCSLSWYPHTWDPIPRPLIFSNHPGPLGHNHTHSIHPRTVMYITWLILDHTLFRLQAILGPHVGYRPSYWRCLPLPTRRNTCWHGLWCHTMWCIDNSTCDAHPRA